ncbi:hypothetical protein [Intrasporangium sp. YIM S08009]|uniref:hypothetical protein n=1 Tax=Intrasporangium zincisolvens TaxID=3080018 RepID=UPI002B053284|nr:hypothetical protein [Intrasporangium sp. YIM S08009]
MPLFERRRRAPLPSDVRDAVPLAAGEKVLAWGRDEESGGHVLATTHHLAFVDVAGSLAWARPWHEAESGTWKGETGLLTVLWVEHRPTQWRVTEPSLLQQTLRERIQASVVIADEFRTKTRRTVRVVIRQDLATGRLLEQTIAGRGASLEDPEVAAEASERLARLRTEVGL